MGNPVPQQQQLDASAGTLRGTNAHRLHRAVYVARKVPEITAYFWIAKLLSTALGESTSDYFVFHFPGLPTQQGEYVAVILGGVVLAAALIAQFAVRRYIAWVYWFAVVMVAVFGTMAADVLHVVLRVPYLNSTIFFLVCMTVIFAIWYLVEGTLSIHSIDTPRRELFYWATVLATFALGTAAGDLVASGELTTPPHTLGYFVAALLFTGVFILPGLAYRLLGLNAIVAFWFAYIITRPLGASFADYFGKPYFGGLGLGDGVVSAVLAIAMLVVVGYLAFTRRDVAHETGHSHGSHVG